MAIKTHVTVTHANNPQSISAFHKNQMSIGANIAITQGNIISFIEELVDIATHLSYSATQSAL
jgi:hypothetical protein